ncbi:solute carrier family 2, facilitated glucose transporter member 1-like isoform X2 [Paramacrobiotus metropolitanus]|uniref:solute carrier family 2, facilitated glucose transporter member 1-like isoform X2 n=1 Tax=Paramacrobiotus metropolitanus TaxID=2943436 RepID=UPI0024461CAA|nr:solute carrier family 2, facilitated glucose transporter member 1-like isoform X2 [Paramacrobiotus metropolitanus]
MKESKGLTGPLVFAILAAAFGSSFLFGYNIGVINVPQTLVGKWIRDVKCSRLDNQTAPVADIERWCAPILPDTPQEENMFKDNTELNTIWSTVTSIFCAGGLIGALSSGFFVSRFGRKGTLMMNLVTGFLAAALLGFPKLAYSFEMLIIGRFVTGLNSGINSGVPPMYFTEISPASLRGAVGSIHQLFITIAIWVSQILGLPFILGTSWGWPWLFGLSVVPCIYQLLTLPFCPESPKYLYLDKGDEVGAQKALVRLRKSDNVADEMDEMRIEHEKAKSEAKVTVRDLFANPFLRKCTIIAMMLMVMQQFSGINAVMFYSTSIFKDCGMSGNSALYATIGMGGINVLMTVISVILVEKAGRRTLLLVGFAGMAVVTILLSVFMLLHAAGKCGGQKLTVEECKGVENMYPWAAYASMVCVMLFVVMFATGPGSIPWFLVTELFTQGPRAAATSIAVGVNWLCNLIVALSFPFIQSAIGEYTFIVFAVLLVLFVAYTWFKVPETKGKTIEEIQAELRQTL